MTSPFSAYLELRRQTLGGFRILAGIEAGALALLAYFGPVDALAPVSIDGWRGAMVGIAVLSIAPMLVVYLPMSLQTTIDEVLFSGNSKPDAGSCQAGLDKAAKNHRIFTLLSGLAILAGVAIFQLSSLSANPAVCNLLSAMLVAISLLNLYLTTDAVQDLHRTAGEC